MQLNGNQPLKIAAQPPSTPSAAGTKAKASGCTCSNAYPNSAIPFIDSDEQLDACIWNASVCACACLIGSKSHFTVVPKCPTPPLFHGRLIRSARLLRCRLIMAPSASQPPTCHIPTALTIAHTHKRSHETTQQHTRTLHHIHSSSTTTRSKTLRSGSSCRCGPNGSRCSAPVRAAVRPASRADC